MKKALGIVGIGLIAGAVVYILLNKTKVDIVTASKKDSVNVSPDNSISIINQNDIHKDSDELDNVKSKTKSTMSARHDEASKIMKDAVEIICKRSEVSEDENRELEQISEKLDELISEELR